MSSKKQTIARFLLTYLFVWLPLLLISIVLTNNTRDRLIAKEEEAIAAQLVLISNEFDDLYQSHYGNSVKLSRAPELLPYRVMDNYMNGYYAIQFLKNATMFDMYTYDTCLYYGDGRVYSKLGFSSLPIYLGKTLKIQNPEKAAAMFESDTLQTACLWTSGNAGYLLFHSPTYVAAANASVSVNYLIPYTSLARILGRLLDTKPAYVNLRFENGDTVHYRNTGTLSVIPSADFQQDTEADAYTVISQSAKAMGVEIDALYHQPQFYGVVNSTQLLYHLLILTGGLASMLVSVYLSSRRVRRIRSLETMVQATQSPEPTPDGKRRTNDEYTNIRSYIRHIQQEYTDLRSNQSTYLSVFKQQTLRLTLHGYFKEKAEINQMLAVGDMELYEEYFFIGGVLFAEGAEIPAALWDGFAADLCCEEVFGGRCLLIFLLELPHTDASGALRQKTVREIQGILADHAGEEAVFVAVSNVYQNVELASYAYQETLDLLKQADSSRGFAYAIGQSEVSAACDVLQLKHGDLEHLLRAVADQDLPAITQAFKTLNQRIAVNSGTDESRRNLRIYVQESLAHLIQTKMQSVSETLPEGILRVDPSDGAAFEDSILALFQRHLSGDTRDMHFQKILDYIRMNYADCNLTAEQVAQVAGCNKAYLSRLFKAHLQMSYIDFLTQMRMAEAKKLLRNTDLTIKEIVTRVGYIDDSSFRRKFKALFGISIMDYRNGYDEPIQTEDIP